MINCRYIIAINYGDVKGIFPYLSETGALMPEAGYFTLLISTQAILSK